MMMTKVAPALDAALIERVENLQTTAEYLTTIVETVLAELNDGKKALETCERHGLTGGGFTIAGMSEWRHIETFCCLALDQIAIVNAVAVDVEKATMAAARSTAPLPAGFHPFTGVAV